MSTLTDGLLKYGADVENVLDRFLNDEELLESCLNEFVNQNEFDDLVKAMGKKDYDEAFEYAHALKGVSGNLGLTPLFDTICVLVESLRHKKLDNVEEELKNVLVKKEEFIEFYKSLS